MRERYTWHGKIDKFNECVATRFVTHFLAVSRTHGQIQTQIQAHIAIELACLAHVQGLAMKSAWESSGGPEQDTETETEREKEKRETAELR